MSENRVKEVRRFTWNMLYDCNYRCSYCFFEGKWQEYKKRNIYLAPDEWLQYWKRIYDEYGAPYIVITGGEPFIYPAFIEIIKKLSEISFHINISSNSSGDLDKFVKEINPQKVSLSLSFQPEFDKLEDFIKRVLFIRKYKFNGCINLVAYPPFFKDIDSYKARFASIGESLKIISFFGEYQDMIYPEGYTQQERDSIGIDDAWFRKIRKRGSLCPAGQRTALIFPDGKVARCGQIGENMVLGNFFAQDFKLLDSPLPCEAEYCPCDEGEVIAESGDKNEKIILADTGQRAECEMKPEPIPDSSGADREESLLAGTNQLAESEIKPEPSPDSSGTAREESLLAGINHCTECEIKPKPKPDSSSASAPRKIRFTWDIHYKCNFRCPYCWFYTGWADAARQNVYLSPEEWMVHWERIHRKYGSVHIEITGGEPFMYPNFIKLVKLLSAVHTVKVTTNMSGDVESFAREIDPKRVNMDFNYHPLFIELGTLIRKVLILKKAGFKGGVCYLAYPPQMKLIDSVRKRIEDAGINFALAAFWGEYRGKKYPESYTEQEREDMKPFLGDINRIVYHLNAESPRGKLCNAGYGYAGIHANGDVVRCGPLADRIIGNIMGDDFKLLDEPAPCQADSCPCNEYVNLLS